MVIGIEAGRHSTVLIELREHKQVLELFILHINHVLGAIYLKILRMLQRLQERCDIDDLN